MKLVVIGNCQWVGVTQCLHAITGLPDIAGVSGEALASDPVLALRGVEAADVVLVQTGKCDRALQEVAPEIAARAVRFPRIAFNAFHPDMCAVHAPGGIVQTPMGNNSSRLVFAAWRRGMSEAETAALFRGDVYRAVGYLDAWAGARATLEADFAQSDVETGGLLARWSRTGCFMHSSNHPKIHVLADVALSIARHLGLEVRTSRADAYVPDVLKDAPIWPVFPEIGAVHGLEGDYCFRTDDASGRRILSLQEFIAASFAAYARATDARIEDFDADAHGARAVAARAVVHVTPAPVVKNAGHNPYSDAADHQVWRRAVAAPAMADVDPVGTPKFKLGPSERVATAGSCFAQHIAARLKGAGLNYLVTERAPAGVAEAEAARQNYGQFSARYGNIYSARQLDQLFARALGDDRFDEVPWARSDGRLADPFRPSVAPAGFADVAALEADRKAHLAAVRAMMEELDTLVFTLGLTEAWVSVRTGAVFPSAPGVVAGAWDPAEVSFRNFSADEVAADARAAFAKVRSVNPRARFILTVSPVPLAATFEPRHVLQSTAYSKAALRVAAETVCADDPGALYFPSYEIITAPFSHGAYFEPDLRNVTSAGVDHVMRLFLHHMFGHAPVAVPDYEIFCDEDANG